MPLNFFQSRSKQYHQFVSWLESNYLKLDEQAEPKSDGQASTEIDEQAKTQKWKAENDDSVFQAVSRSLEIMKYVTKDCAEIDSFASNFGYSLSSLNSRDALLLKDTATTIFNLSLLLGKKSTDALHERRFVSDFVRVGETVINMKRSLPTKVKTQWDSWLKDMTTREYGVEELTDRMNRQFGKACDTLVRTCMDQIKKAENQSKQHQDTADRLTLPSEANMKYQLQAMAKEKSEQARQMRLLTDKVTAQEGRLWGKDNFTQDELSAMINVSKQVLHLMRAISPDDLKSMSLGSMDKDSLDRRRLRLALQWRGFTDEDGSTPR